MEKDSLNDQSSASYMRFTVLPLWLLAVLGFGAVLHYASELFIWVTCSLFLFALLDPLHVRLRNKKISSELSAFILIISVMILSISILYLLYYFSADLVTQFRESKRLFQSYYTSLTTWLKDLISGLSHPTGAVPARDVVTGKVIPKVEVVEGSPLGGSMGDTVLAGVGNAAQFLTYFCLWPVLSFFMMAERDVFGKVIARTFTDPNRASESWNKIVGITRAFFLGNFILIISTVPFFAITFYFFGAKPVIMLSILASLINAIPFVGAILTGVLPAFAVLGQTQNISLAIWIYLYCGFFHFVASNFITPKILGSKVNLNATTSTISLIVWSLLWGPMGLILAIPITASIKIIFEYSGYPWLCWIAALMSQKMDPIIRLTIGRKKSVS